MRRHNLQLGGRLGDVRHIAGHREEDVVARRHETSLQAGEGPGRALAVEHHAVRHQVLHLFGLGERDHHLRERRGEPFHHVAQQDGVPHLEPRLRAAHAPAVAPGKHQQRRLHHD